MKRRMTMKKKMRRTMTMKKTRMRIRRREERPDRHQARDGEQRP
jgi:hypothetical protein